MSTQPSQAVRNLPGYLKVYVTDQRYDEYTPKEHATWRFIMRAAREYFQENAHPIYLGGLEKTGIPVERIPRIPEMDQVLSEFGWGAVCVDGFIPPLAFLDFQTRKILPIARDMRRLEHIDYTPAPDIVHEAAGHAPIIADPGYAAYLERYSFLARKAIFSQDDIAFYEAVRRLSDVKENEDATAEEIESAELGLKRVVEGLGEPSEAAKIARIFWWTAEYGLIKSTDREKPKIYGAGLLSSLAESRTCFDSSVKKVPFSLACADQSYDITRPQPQLFVADNFKKLEESLGDFEADMAFARGGAYALEVASQSKTVTTAQVRLPNARKGVQISGIVSSFRASGDGVSQVSWQPPLQICVDEKELSEFRKTVSELDQAIYLDVSLCPLDLENAQPADSVIMELDIISGRFALETKLVRQDACFGVVLRSSTGQKLLLIEGNGIDSVFGGPGDLSCFSANLFGEVSTSPSRTSPYSAEEQGVFALYKEVRVIRDQLPSKDERRFSKICQEVMATCPDEWLLLLECFELATLYGDAGLEIARTIKPAVHLAAQGTGMKTFVDLGMDLAKRTS